ncbi:MAG: hypothetical protein LBB83_12195 [Treponema sp.]|jgi:hypothetical protein|nr:hypothetical protein [Treponema sp.]
MDEKTSSSISAIVAWICIAAYILALVVAGIQIGFNIKDRQAAAEQEFSGLANRCSQINAQAFMNEAFQNTIQDTLSYSDNLQGIILTGPDGEYAFERALSGVINWVGNSPRFAKQFGTSSRALFSPLDIVGLRNVTLSAVYRYIDFDLLLSELKRTLIIVLAALTIAFFALILESVTDKKHLAETETGPPYSSSSYSSAGGGDSKTAAGRPVQKARQTAPPEKDSEQGDDSFFSDDSFDDIFGTDDKDTPVSDDFPGFAPDTEDVVSFEEDAADAGPGHAPGGIGPEEDTRERLGAELRRSESSGQDLTVIVLEYGNPDDPDGIWFRDFVRMTADYFDSGAIFGKGKTGITVILPGVDLAGGKERLRGLKNRIPTTFNQGLAVGLSSRRGRPVKADRILSEAAQSAVLPGEDAVDTGPERASPNQAAARALGGADREENAQKRLDAELRRSESSGQDLTVVVLEYGNPDDPEGIWFRDFVRMTADYFDSGGMIFGKGKMGITVILPDTDINSGIKKVKELRGRIPSTFTQKLAMGLSSRLGRFVKAERILLEAAEASAKSKKDPENRIVSFKSDPDKYRAFIEKKSVQ